MVTDALTAAKVQHFKAEISISVICFCQHCIRMRTVELNRTVKTGLSILRCAVHTLGPIFKSVLTSEVSGVTISDQNVCVDQYKWAME